ncbi:uncharacterized protein LOC132243495 [Alligator mississippiensis]|uniref:uncharacterized protein LOC132243495 n=1 Tax=Alligator mississippiensis TaxID=8496 RepID=UPI00287804E2|nr:uncharacterized protein LOC132243495 [Alligator mississippiensis]
MALVPLLLFLCIYFSGAGAQSLLTQPPSVSASPGGTVTITCARSSGSISDSWNSWYQQKPGRAPVMVIYEDTKRPSGIPTRFSGSIDESANTATLTISGVQPDDEADYYCLTYDSSSNATVLQTQGELRQKPPSGLQSLDSRFPAAPAARWEQFLKTELVWTPIMAWAPLLLALLTYYPGVRSQSVVTQEPAVSVSPGGTVTLSCSLSTGAITTSNYPHWYQQKPGSPPRVLIYSTNNRPSGIPTRFSGSISGQKAVLTITGVQAEDESDYYCSVYIGSDV